jgi:processive 1,2-diacylglycerol beta-glucosyltransferase
MNDNVPRSPRRRLLIVTASVGAGHNSVARALRESVAAVEPDVEITVMDVLDYTPPWFRAYYAGGYVLGMTRLPCLYGLGYILTNRPQRPGRGAAERIHLCIERFALQEFRQRLLELHPDLIVNTHFLAGPVEAELVRSGCLPAKLMTIVTDIEVHRFWLSEGIDQWFLPTEYSAQFLLRWGIDPRRMSVTGIPVGAKWLARLDRAVVCRDWQLPEDKPIVLLSGGTEFVCGPIVRIAERIVRSNDKAVVVVLGGRNKKLLEELSEVARQQPRIRPLSFTDRANELADVASLMITKPGGAMTAECLAKSLPMVLLKPVHGQESGNAYYLAHNGAAALTSNADDAVATTLRLLENPRGLQEMSAQTRRIYRHATPIVTEAICRELNSAVQ